jgi:hypothetical protein
VVFQALDGEEGRLRKRCGVQLTGADKRSLASTVVLGMGQ